MIFKGDGINKKKFEQIAFENGKKIGNSPYFTPEGWAVLKPQYILFIKDMDELAEVYNLENGVKDGK